MMPDRERRRFMLTAEKFRTAGRLNQTAIDAARRATERVVSHIVDAVRRQSNAQPTAYGRPSLAARKPSARPLSVNINQTL